MARTTEFVLGLLGGIFGIFAGFFALAVGGLGSAFGAEGAGQVVGLGWSAILFSILGIIGSVVVKFKPKWGGAMMTVAAIGGTISVSAFYILSGVLLIIGGLMGLFRKSKSGDVVQPQGAPVLPPTYPTAAPVYAAPTPASVYAANPNPYAAPPMASAPQAAVQRLKCPRCKSVVEVPAGAKPRCTNCGFGG